MESNTKDKRRRKPNILEGGKRLAVSPTEAAEIMGLKDKKQFDSAFVANGLIEPSINPKSNEEFYSIYDLIDLFEKTKSRPLNVITPDERVQKARSLLYSN